MMRYNDVLMRTVALGVLLAANSAEAQNAASGEARSGSEEVLQDIVVTAQHRSENIQDIPIAVNALDGQTLKNRGVNSSEDIAEFIPNLQISLPYGVGSQPIITIRGVGLNDVSTNNAGPNGVYIDDVYMSSPASQSFQTFDLERVEVLKGPQGTLYGRNTTGGAISYISARPTDEPSASVHASYGSYNTYQVDGFVNGPLDDRVNARIAFNHNGSDGFMKNLQTGQRQGGTDDYAVRTLFEIKPSDDLTLLLNLHWGRQQTLATPYHEVGTLDPSTGGFCSTAQVQASSCVDAYGYHGPSNLYKGNYNRTEETTVAANGASLRADYSLEDVTLTSITAYESSRRTDPEDSDSEPLRLLEIDWGVTSKSYSQEFRAAGGDAALHWVGGLYYMNEILWQNQTSRAFQDLDLVFGPGAGEGVALVGGDTSRQRTSAYAAFGQTDFDVADGLRLTLGGRFTHEEKTFATVGALSLETNGAFPAATPIYAANEKLENNAASWRAALDYEVEPDIHVYTSVATGFKSGGYNGGFLASNPVDAAIQLRPIQPEKVTAYEVGFKTDLLDRRLRFNGAAFYYDYTNMQVYNLTPASSPGDLPVSVLVNAPTATIKGVELELSAKPLAGLTTSVNLGYLDARMGNFNLGGVTTSLENLTGNRLPSSPRVTAIAMADYAIPLANQATVTIGTSASYRTRQFFDIRNNPLLVQGAYWLLDAQVRYSSPGDRWSLGVFTKNLTGTKYITYGADLSNPFGFIQQVAGAPRTVGIQATLHF
ncbi:TonB-dependent receptor [Nitrospirillum sp. BR 11163]|uniref:TonB-dependent receptor n=1 Tax=Nitrospirillum sp. BR 11163 TaxID=3104323 RepID=UPI002AFDD132|nr:TonB-dependent receptor [Nitrospirillum sp. BR 11163]MEA1671895.1 TonB-dependent receptor [Nitrospirillum sp. BR 11163]